MDDQQLGTEGNLVFFLCRLVCELGTEGNLVSFLCRLVCGSGSFCISLLVYTVRGQYYSSLVIRFYQKA